MSDGKWHDSKEWCERDGKGKCIYCEICGEGGTLLRADMNITTRMEEEHVKFIFIKTGLNQGFRDG